MGFDMAAIDRQFFRDRSRRRDLLEQALPDAPLGPAIVAVIDRRRWAIGGRDITPAASRLQHMQNTGDHRAVIYPRFARFAVWQMRLDRSPCLVRKPKQMA